MDDLRNLAQVLETLLEDEPWQPREARALLRAGRALAREQGRPGTFDHLLSQQHAHQPPPWTGPGAA